ncbi:MAG: helix-turn-helix transcriptional regulator [Clostridia bacterium]|nr:helix-turn-helix transcriptional regulator [Clostridia bacterium]
MIYQKLLLGNESYFVSACTVKSFELHRHPEVELSYCLRGFYSIIVDNEKHHIKEGDFVLISPTVAHEIIASDNRPSTSVTVELGPALLGDYFNGFVNLKSKRVFLNLKNSSEKSYKQLRNLFEEIADMYVRRPEFHNLVIKGNLYKISSVLLQLLYDKKLIQAGPFQHHNIVKIEKAIEIIYNRYSEPLDIESVSAECGYSKSSFCKIFKEITGETFHSVLNRHRIEIACMHLKNSTASVEEIALNAGFSDLKSFCRVFKKITGESSGSYRKRNR